MPELILPEKKPVSIRKSEQFFQNSVLPIIRANGSSASNFAKYASFIAEKDPNRFDLSLPADSKLPVKNWVREYGAVAESLVLSASLNPFDYFAEFKSFDLLTDSGTSGKTASQNELKEKWGAICSDVNHYAYARSPARQVLDLTVAELFGENFKFHLTLQGRASEFLLLASLKKIGFLPKKNLIARILRKKHIIASNTPFDTTKGHILNSGNYVIACTPVTKPDVYSSGKEVFLGNLP
ncbi:MAG: beta-eliminating lyase-related protein, partial [Candidatus Micrarchaeota archaeon]|nr:beta-eliminating lyase-related protein [Candidatus Micrarchaeota archaeon]